MSEDFNRHAGFTLLELTAVVTLMAVAVAMVTINAQGLSDDARLRAAASQIASVVGLAETQATASGMPRLLVPCTEGVVVHEPVCIEGRWEWSPGVTVRLPEKVNAFPVSDRNGRRSMDWSPPAGLVIRPGTSWEEWEFQLMLSNGAERNVTVNALTGIVRFDSSTDG
jgi:prepilin-type N-terminal cleavage/methylation domain-containing protein